MWKATVGALPVGNQLLRHGINLNPHCKKCGAMETITHVFRDCFFAQKVWSLAPFASNVGLIDGCFLHLLSKTRDLSALPPTGLSEAHLRVWICWFLWTARNELLFSDRSFSQSEVIVKATREAKAWQEAQAHLEKPCQTPCSSLSLPKRSHGFTCFVDAAWNSSSLACGMGCVISAYSNPLIIFRGTFEADSIPSALSAEALALRAAITAALEVDCEDVQFFSDNSILMQLLYSDGDHKEIHFLLCDIRELIPLFNFFKIGYIPRLENVEADLLAKNALRGLPSISET